MLTAASDVAVLWGAGGTFSAGADLKAVGGPDGNRASPVGDGPDGAHPDAAVQAGDRRDQRVRGRLAPRELAALV